MPRFKTAAIVFAALLSSSALSVSASAMPVSGLAPAAPQKTAHVQNVRWVCGPYRCFWRPGPVWWGPGRYWGPRRWGWRGGWGWRRRWR
jgi:hypothetical protein